MKATELPDDDELRRLIRVRFGDAVGVAGPPYISTYENFGTKPEAPWRRPALFAVNALRAEGASVTEALRTVYGDHDIQRVASSSFESFIRSYQEFRHDELREHFLASILCGEIGEAIDALKFCQDATRQAIWEDLNRDSPPRPAP